ncbi:MAG: glucokinase [Lyngbya sp. HA4199-MV5]|jgi:glucokinase|nr:glucokinase [Lyngbya sp. HA4199-MV5]
MTLLLAGDIGGTKTALRLVDAAISQSTPETTLKTLHENRYVSANFIDLVPMVQQFLMEAEQTLGYAAIPEKACFAIAGPVLNHTSKLTNLSWSLSVTRLSQQLDMAQVSLINDFAAVGYGVLGLQPSDLLTLQPGKPQADAPIAIIGAGTGLGQGFVIAQEGDYKVYPTEGGHADFAPRTEVEFQLSRYLLDKHNIQRLSVERVVSGQGIVAIYQFLRDRQLAEESPDVEQVVRTWERETGRERSVDPAAAISQAALEKRDRLSEQTMHLFVDAYGAEAGNLALKLLPYGGLYVAGGIAPKILPLIQDSTFLSSLIDKGRMLPLLEAVPVHIVLNPTVGLIGAALYASKL